MDTEHNRQQLHNSNLKTISIYCELPQLRTHSYSPITNKWTLHCPPVSILWYVNFFLYNRAKSTKRASLCSIWLYGYLNSFLLQSSVAVSLIGLNRNNTMPRILESVQRLLLHAPATLQSWERDRERERFLWSNSLCYFA